jgi:SAM-dependent methyltransferase
MPGARQTAGRLKRRVQTAVRPGGPTVDTLSAASLVDLAFQITRDRAPTPAERDRLVIGLESGNIDRAAFLADLRSDYAELPPEAAVRLGYTMLLRREPDAVGRQTMLGHLATGGLDHWTLIDFLRGSGEYANLGFSQLGSAVHSSRCRFIRTLPPSARILDLGGTDLGHETGALVSMGWPYRFDELVIIDLPPEDRHEIYVSEAHAHVVDTRRGPVRYEYHSMADLSRYATDSFDLVYSGQTFEHVTEEDGNAVLEQVRRVLRPGGCFALDTPNATVCRMQQAHFIDPDHKIEYTAEQLDEKLRAAGFEITGRWGLVYGGEPVLEGSFSEAEAARNAGMFADVEHCYLLAYTALSP